MANSLAEELEDIAARALSVAGVQSAAIFFVAPSSSTLQLAAAAGIQGPALDGLLAAVRDPDHPVARTLTDDGPTFDVVPITPGGPRLRSHLPLVVGAGDARRALGVMAVAHDSPLDEDQRAQLIDLAARAASAIGR